MAGVTGLEPAASGVTGRRSNRLSYTPAKGQADRLRLPPYLHNAGERASQAIVLGADGNAFANIRAT